MVEEKERIRDGSTGDRRQGASYNGRWGHWTEETQRLVGTEAEQEDCGKGKQLTQKTIAQRSLERISMEPVLSFVGSERTVDIPREHRGQGRATGKIETSWADWTVNRNGPEIEKERERRGDNGQIG